MKAMVLQAPGKVGLAEVEHSRHPEDVLVRVTHSGVCGTDLKIYRGAIPVHYPLIMGHEMIGEVAEAGENHGLKPGDRVIVDPVLFCGHCFHCKIGQTHLCPHGRLLGRDDDGGFAEYVSAPASHIYKLPPSVDNQVAPLIQVVTTCMHAQRQAAVFPGESVVVLGLGVSGQIHLQLAKARGAHPLIGITRSGWKRRLAEELGAHITLPPDEKAENQIREVTEGRGADLVIETTGKVEVLAEAIKMARIGGRLLLFGITTVEKGSLPFYQLYFKELSVINSRAAKGEDYPGSIDLARRGVLQLEKLVSNVMDLGQLDQAIGLLESGSGAHMKIIMEHF